MKRLAMFAVALVALALPLAAQTSFSASLTGTAETTVCDEDGVGFAAVRINGTTVEYALLVQNIGTVTGAHIHEGAAGVDGDVVVDFAPTFMGGNATGSVTAEQSVIDAILANPSNYYVNVHTNACPAGAIRGQLGAPQTGGGSMVSFVPVVGKVPGAAGTNFVTDVRIINQSTGTANVTLDYYQSPGGQITATSDMTIAAGEQAVLDDIIGVLEGSGLGGFRVTADQNVQVLTRVINDLRSEGLGTTGFAVNASTLADAKTRGTLGFLSQASGADVSTGVGFRTNLGYFNPTANTVNLTLTAFDSDGVSLGTSTVAVPGFGFSQQALFAIISSVPEGMRVQENFYVTWSSSAPILVYAAVVDNLTGDSVLIQ